MAEKEPTEEQKRKIEEEATQKAVENSKKRITALEKEISAKKLSYEQDKLTAQTQEELDDLEKKRIDLELKIIEQKRERLKVEKQLGNLNEEKYKQGIREAQDEKKKLDRDKLRIESLKQIEKGWFGVTIGQSLALTGAKELFNAENGLNVLENARVMTLKKLAEQFTAVANAEKEAAIAGYGLFDSVSLETQGMSKFLGVTRNANGELATMTRFGIGFKELQEAENGLRDSMVSFTDASAAGKEMMKANAAQMKNLGVSVETSGKNFNFLTKSLQMTDKQAVQTADKLARVGLAAGISTKKMLSDFAQVGPGLAAQGQKAVQIFGDLAKQAKSLGVEVNTLMDTFGSAMDTFEGAATTAGKFNAVMGGDYLNAIELLNASESERVEIVKRQMDATGRNFATMSKYEKIAVANALGVKNIDDANKMLSGSTAEMIKKQQKQAETEERLNKLKEEAVDVGARLASMFQVVAGVAAPFFKILEVIASVITRLNDAGKGLPAIIISGLLLGKGLSMLKVNFNQLGTSIKTTFITMKTSVASAVTSTIAGFRAMSTGAIGFGSTMRAVGAAIKNINWGGVMGALFNSLPLLIMLFQWLHDVLLEPNSPILMDVLSTTLPTALNTVGAAAAALVKPMLAFGFSVLMIGGGIFAAAYGLSLLVKSFAELNPSQILGAVAAITIFGVVIISILGVLAALAFSGVGVAAVGLLLAFGGAFLMIGAGVWIAAQGMKTFVDSAMLLASSGSPVAESLLKIAGVVFIVAISIGVLTASLFALMVLGASGVFGFLVLAAGVKMAVWAFEELGQAFNTFPTEKSIQFKASADSLTDTLKAVKELKSEDVKPTLDVMKGAREYLVEIAAAPKSEDPVVKLLTKILEVANIATGKGGEKKEEVYQIKLNERVFGELVRKEAGVGSSAAGRLAGVKG